MELALALILRDKASTPAAKAIDKVVKKSKDLETSSKGVKAEADNAAQALNKIGGASQALEKAAAAARDVAKSGKEVRTEFDQTSRAIEKTATAGRILGNTPIPLTMREGVRNLIADSKTLERTLVGVKTAVGGLTLHNARRAVSGAVAGYQAGKAVVAPAFSQVMDYSMRLTHMTNTAYAGMSIKDKTAGLQELNGGIVNAVRTGGGTRDTALEAADSMLARGSIGNVADVMKLMPTVMKTATAGNADATEIGAIASAAVKQGDVPVDQIGKLLGMALYGGQQGGFELKDMSKWLPSQFAMAKQAGISGMPGAAKIIALNEMAIDSSGTTDAAGNNVRDFLHELNASNTANHLKRFSIDKKSGSIVEKHGRQSGGDYIDLGHTLAYNQERGVDAIDSVIGIVQKIAESDPKFNEAKAKLAVVKQRAQEAQKNGNSTEQSKAIEEQQAIYQSVYQILLGRGVGKMFQNQQSLLGGIGAIMNPADYRQKVAEYQAKGGINTIDNNFDFIKENPGFKLQQKQQEEAFALQTGLEGATGALGKYADVVTDVYRKYPAFGSAIEGATVVVNGLTAALAGLGLMKLLAPGAVAGGASKIIGSAGADAASVAASGGALTAARFFAMRVAPVLLLGGDSRQADNAPDREKAVVDSDDQMRAKGYKRVKGLLFDSYERDDLAKVDAAATSDLYGTPEAKARFSRQFDQSVNNFTGVDPRSPVEQAALAAGNYETQQSSGGSSKALEQAAAALTAVSQQPIVVKSELTLDGRVIAEAVNETNGRSARRQ